MFERQRKGEITTASEEQIRELSRSCSRGGRGRGGGGSGSSEWEIKPSSLTGKRPRHSNKHGRLFEITGDECPHLRMLDMEVGLANITSVSVEGKAQREYDPNSTPCIDQKCYIYMVT